MLPDGNDDVPTSDKDTHTSFMSPQSFHSPAPFWDSNHHMQNINKNMVIELDNLIIFFYILSRRQSLIENGHNMGSPNSHISSSGTSHITSASGYQLHLERKNQNMEQQSSRISHHQPSLVSFQSSND